MNDNSLEEKHTKEKEKRRKSIVKHKHTIVSPMPILKTPAKGARGRSPREFVSHTGKAQPKRSEK